MNKNTLAIGAIIASSVIWGTGLIVMKANITTIPPWTLAFLRFMPAAFLSLVFAKFRHIKFKDILHIGFWALFGISLNISLLLIGLKSTSAVDATLVDTLGPIVTSLLAVFMLREKINSSHAVGIFLAFVGVFVYTFYPLVTRGEHFSFNLYGDLLVFLSITTAAIYTIGSKRLFEKYTPTTVAGVSFLVGALTFLPGSIYESFTSPMWLAHFSLFNLASILFLIFGSSFSAYLLFEWGLSHVEAHITAAIGNLNPVVSIILAATFLHETLNPSFGFAAVLIVIGIYLVIRTSPHIKHRYHHRIHKI